MFFGAFAQSLQIDPIAQALIYFLLRIFSRAKAIELTIDTFLLLEILYFLSSVKQKQK
jgi:hypothetical protein